MMGPEARGAVAALESLLEGLHLSNPAIASEFDTLRTGALEILRTKLAVACGARPLVIVVAGGTNVGKSTVFNLIAGEPVSAISPLARGTKTPVIGGSASTLAELEAFLPGVEMVPSVGFTGAGAEAFDVPTVLLVRIPSLPYGCLLVDSPDMDSDYPPNRRWATRLLHACDAVILVVTPEKYHDAVVVDFISQAASLGRMLGAVMNKTESVGPLDDFVEAVWRPTAGASPVLAIPWDGGDAHVEELRELVQEWAERPDPIRRGALAGSLRVLDDHLDRLATMVDEEQRLFREIHRGIDAAIDDAARRYRQEVSVERFEELDVVFRRLLREFRIPVLDDFYDGVRAMASTVARGLRRVGTGHARENTARIVRERQRIDDICATFALSLSRLVDTAPESLRAMTREWRSRVPTVPDEGPVDEYLLQVRRDVEDWVAGETAAIARAIGAHPGLRSVAVAVKSTLQIGAGVMGAVLTGGLNATDLAVVPAVERVTAYLLERGLGYPYFVRCRCRLLDVREASFRRFVSTLAEPMRKTIPSPDPRGGDCIREAARSLPDVQEFLR